MKTMRFLAIIMVLAISMSLFVMPTSATEVDEHDHDHIEIYFEDDNLSDKFKEKATAFYLNGGEETDGNAVTYGVTCNLFGHNLEIGTTTTTTHKARATAPRCLKKTYTYETCTRCDYQTSTLKSSTYIYCCS